MIEGSVYVNDSMKPTAGFLRIRAGDYYVFGQGSDLVFNNSLYRYFVENVYGKENVLLFYSIGWLGGFFDETFQPYLKENDAF